MIILSTHFGLLHNFFILGEKERRRRRNVEIQTTEWKYKKPTGINHNITIDGWNTVCNKFVSITVFRQLDMCIMYIFQVSSFLIGLLNTILFLPDAEEQEKNGTKTNNMRRTRRVKCIELFVCNATDVTVHHHKFYWKMATQRAVKKQQPCTDAHTWRFVVQTYFYVDWTEVVFVQILGRYGWVSELTIWRHRYIYIHDGKRQYAQWRTRAYIVLRPVWNYLDANFSIQWSQESTLILSFRPLEIKLKF